MLESFPNSAHSDMGRQRLSLSMPWSLAKCPPDECPIFSRPRQPIQKLRAGRGPNLSSLGCLDFQNQPTAKKPKMACRTRHFRRDCEHTDNISHGAHCVKLASVIGRKTWKQIAQRSLESSSELGASLFWQHFLASKCGRVGCELNAGQNKTVPRI